MCDIKNIQNVQISLDKYNNVFVKLYMILIIKYTLHVLIDNVAELVKAVD
jgi:hypothetical protein